MAELSRQSDPGPRSRRAGRGDLPALALVPAPRARSAGDEAAARHRGSEDQGWRRRYVASLPFVDALAALVAAVVGYGVRYGSASHQWLVDLSLQPAWSVVLLPVAWVALVGWMRGYEQRFLWVGPEEFRRVLTAGVTVLALVASTAWAFRLDVARGYVVVALPLTVALTLLARWGLRRRLQNLRREGRRMHSTLVVGQPHSVRSLVHELERQPGHGLEVVGCCTAPSSLMSADGVVEDLPVPVLGGVEDVAGLVRRHGIHTVAVLPCSELDPTTLRRLGWQLEGTSAELVVSPGIAEVAGPRVAIRPFAGLPLLHLERPEIRGLRKLAKSAIDRSAAAAALLVLAPVLAVVAVLVARTSPGPVLFRQERIGEDGRPFTMYKFRSMVVDAEERLADLMAENEGNGVLFKMRTDPRLTPIGGVLRRYSLDELPQLLNVLLGDMSLVGPRPPLASEVSTYGTDMHRRFAVKPGITGLWQVSGRSDLSAEESERLDVRYVESWSPATDAVILWKTVGTVVKGRGAY